MSLSLPLEVRGVKLLGVARSVSVLLPFPVRELWQENRKAETSKLLPALQCWETLMSLWICKVGLEPKDVCELNCSA